MNKVQIKNIFSTFGLNCSLADQDHNQKLQVYNPYTGDLVANVKIDSIKSTREKISHLYDGLNNSNSVSIIDRGKLLKKWHQLISANRTSLAQLIVMEQGKPLKDAIAEVDYGASFVEWYSEEGKRLRGEILESPFENREFLVYRKPVGLVVTITPWNFPMAMFVRKAGAAIAAGCNVLTKPAEDTPLTTLALISLAREAGIGVNLLDSIIIDKAGVKKIGSFFCSDRRVSKISFTGSTNVGKTLLEQGAQSLKKFALELGGNAPFIVREDADIKKAVDGLILCKFRNSGQTCVCANRIFVHRAIFDEFRAAFVNRAKKLAVGSGFDSDTQIGPLINKAARTRYLTILKDLINSGGKVWLDGKGSKDQPLLFYPTVVEAASDKVKAFNEEIFGPLAVLYKFEDDMDVISRANSTNYGLASYVYTNDREAIKKYTKLLDFGIVCFNEGSFSNPVAPFGGTKDSGFGREGGSYGLEEFLETKFTSIS